MNFSHPQRLLLTLFALVSLFGTNGVFIYFALRHADEFWQVMRHPVTAALMTEAFLVVALLAALLVWRPLGRWGWKTFVLLSLLGGLGFSLPTILLLNKNDA